MQRLVHTRNFLRFFLAGTTATREAFGADARSGSRCRDAHKLRLLTLLASVMFSVGSAALFARQGQPKPLSISGIVIEISPQRMTIQGSKGSSVTLTPERDYTEQVAFGSEVNATYVLRNGSNVLLSLTPPLENLFVPAYEIKDRVHKVIILPSSDVTGADGFYDALRQYLQSNLNWYVKPTVLAEEIRRTSGGTQSTLDLIDPNTGNFDMSRYVAGTQNLVRKIADETRVDAVVEADLKQVQAALDASRRVATWDGFQQSTSASGGRGLGLLAVIPIKGEIPAVTLDLKLRDSQGKILWTRRRGFSVLLVQEGLVGKFRPYPLTEALENKAIVEGWLNDFFAPLLVSRKTPPITKDHR